MGCRTELNGTVILTDTEKSSNMAGSKIIYNVINKADFKNNPALASILYAYSRWTNQR
jgi:hypothetical protein